MRIKDIKPGQKVWVTRGYSRRPATVQRLVYDGKVAVRFDDTSDLDLSQIPQYHRSNLFGYAARPNAIEPRAEA